uniref:Uncharacterized protein n=1 Tax=Rhizophora mucronata TaxID=61149 RepID=A0A2P2Q172_RHIMU
MHVCVTFVREQYPGEERKGGLCLKLNCFAMDTELWQKGRVLPIEFRITE